MRSVERGETSKDLMPRNGHLGNRSRAGYRELFSQQEHTATVPLNIRACATLCIVWSTREPAYAFRLRLKTYSPLTSVRRSHFWNQGFQQ